MGQVATIIMMWRQKVLWANEQERIIPHDEQRGFEPSAEERERLLAL